MTVPFILGMFGAHEETLSHAIQGLQIAKTAGCDAFAIAFWSSPPRMRTRRHVAEPSTQYDLGSARAEWLGYLKNGCAGLDLLFAVEVALPEDVEAVSRHADVFLVSPFEARDRELTRAISAARGERPFFVATGMQAAGEVTDIPSDAIRLHGVAASPCPIEQANLGAIELHEGYFDTTRVVFTGGLAVMAGADYLVLPYRLTQTSPACPGYAVALSPGELAKSVYFARTAALARGDGEKVVQESERMNLQHRVVS